jgi:DNA-binding NarL/FixJ family response regulator
VGLHAGALFRRGLVGLLNEMDGFEVVGEAGNGWDSLRVVETTRPDLVLLDVNMPEMGGVETLREIRARYAALPVLMLTISEDDDDLLGAILAGASGYLLKNAEPETLRQVMLRILAGESVLSPEVTAKVFDALRRMQAERGRNLLSSRELEVLDCMRRGLTTPEIATELFISENTVKTHSRHILEKLGVRKRSEAVARAVDLNLV